MSQTKTRPRLGCLPPATRASLAQLYIRDQVLEAASRVPLRGRWGATYCYISCVWSELQRVQSPVALACTLDDFRGWLPRAYRAGLVRLARADSFSVLQPGTYEASEVRSGTRIWHLVFDPCSDPFSC